jgi:hypothetical protein
MNSKRNGTWLKKRFRVIALAGLVLAGAGGQEALATDVGPLPFTIRTTATSQTLTLSGVPGKTLVSVRGRMNALPLTFPPISVPMTVDVFRPEGGAAVASFDVTAAPVFSMDFPLIPMVPALSDFGCPRTWRVVVHTTNNLPPPVNVAGSITFSFFPPGTFPNPLPAVYNVDMEGPSIHIEGGGASATTTLAGHDPLLLGVANRSLIQGTEGSFRIRAKWDTSFNVCFLGQTFPLDVALRRSTAGGGTGGVANSENAFSQTSSEANKVSFAYTATPADAMLPGPWRLRVTNNNTVGCGLFGNVNVGIDNFDIENLVFPTFVSTFTPGCSEAIGAADLAPVEATTQVRQPINYAFTWTVPDGLNWHNLEALQLRIRDEEGTALSAVFLERSNTISVFNEASGRFGKGFAPGSPNRLETPEATLYLAQSSIVAAGPTSPTVTLNLSVSFKPQAAGRTFIVEVGATDKSHEGTLSGFFEELGSLTVEK